MTDTKNKTKRKVNKSTFFIVFLLVMALSPMAVFATTGTQVGGNIQNDELEGVWEKIGSIIEGTGGKMAALAIILVSVWNREKIGIPYMSLGVVAGLLLPSLPSIVNNFTFTI